MFPDHELPKEWCLKSSNETPMSCFYDAPNENSADMSVFLSQIRYIFQKDCAKSVSIVFEMALRNERLSCFQARNRNAFTVVLSSDLFSFDLDHATDFSSLVKLLNIFLG